MDLQKHSQQGTISLKVVPNSSRTLLVEENKQLKLYVRSIPEKDKANLELIKYFKKELGHKSGDC